MTGTGSADGEAAALQPEAGAGHVFVVRGRLHQLIADDWLISTDPAGNVEPTWYGALGWKEGYPPPLDERPIFPGGARVAPALDRPDLPRRWFVAVGAPGADVAWLLTGVREGLTAAAEAGRGTTSRGVRQRIAMPVMGVGRGGFDSYRGEVIDGLLHEAQAVATRYAVDVVVVALKPSDYSALQAIRRSAHATTRPGEQETAARELAAHARNGQLALFMGAGTGVPAGLPSWGELLAWLADRTELADSEGLDKLNPLDAAEVLRRQATKQAGSAGGNALGALVAERIGQPTRYALSHILLAALGTEQAITTNFDRLYETAVEAIEGEPPPVVLPDSKQTHLPVDQGSSGWLLKLHGDVGEPASIVLDRRSFVRYDATRRPLGGVLQTTLLTKHLLVVGASMTDDNVIRLVHEVSALHEEGGRAPRRLGTVLALTHDPLRHSLWSPEFSHLELGQDQEGLAEAGRTLEVFLDRVALLAAPTTSHLLDPRYRELLRGAGEREVAADLEGLVERLRRLDGNADPGWQQVAEALSAFGAPLPPRAVSADRAKTMSSRSAPVSVDGPRGLLLGLVLGDALGVLTRGVPAGAGPLRSTVAAQLACFTTEGLIRASVRQRGKGICHPPSVVWHALVRWAHGQGITLGEVYDEWRGGASDDWPDGWLARVPELAQRRGAAPATVAALKTGHQGRRDRPATNSMGSHGLIRTLPVSVLGMPAPETFALAADIAALTHGHPTGFFAAADGAVVGASILAGSGLHEAVDEVERLASMSERTSHQLGAYAAAMADARSSPRDPRLLARHANDRTALAALRGALYVAGSFPRPDQVLDALSFASKAPGSGVGAVCGALLGALHGAGALPPELVNRLELAGVADTLIRDLVSEITDSPGGHETLTESEPGTYQIGWQEGADPRWSQRYPGW